MGKMIVTVGADTHADVHVAAVLDQAGRLLGTGSFPATTRGYAQLATWAESFGAVDKVGMEGTGHFGAGLLCFLADYGLDVVEVDRPDRSARRRNGKSDPLDAESAARAVQSGRAAGTPESRDAQVEMIRVLRVPRKGAMKARNQAGAQTDAVILAAPEPVRAQFRKLSPRQRIRAAAALRPGPLHDPAAATKVALRALARGWQALQTEIDDLDAQLTPLVTTLAPQLVALPGVGVDTAGQLLVTTGDKPKRLRSERSFAPALWRRAGPRIRRAHHPPPAAPRWRPQRQQRFVADRPRPHALPPAHQGLRRPPHRRGQSQNRDPALSQALHRPGNLPPPDRPGHHRSQPPHTPAARAHPAPRKRLTKRSIDTRWQGKVAW